MWCPAAFKQLSELTETVATNNMRAAMPNSNILIQTSFNQSNPGPEKNPNFTPLVHNTGPDCKQCQSLTITLSLEKLNLSQT